LYVSGASNLSAHAIERVREICDAHLLGRHDPSVVDLHQQPALAERRRPYERPGCRHTDVSSRKGAS
jgi:hypothetical protein